MHRKITLSHFSLKENIVRGVNLEIDNYSPDSAIVETGLDHASRLIAGGPVFSIGESEFLVADLRRICQTGSITPKL
jgi:hypothetical protein